jgi:hypothetical protein
MISIVAWRRFGAPVGAVIGSVAVDWYGLIVDSIQVSTSPTGLFIVLPRRRTPNGRWLKFVRFRTVREEQAFKTEVFSGADARPSGGFCWTRSSQAAGTEE